MFTILWLPTRHRARIYGLIMGKKNLCIHQIVINWSYQIKCKHDGLYSIYGSDISTVITILLYRLFQTNRKCTEGVNRFEKRNYFSCICLFSVYLPVYFLFPPTICDHQASGNYWIRSTFLWAFIIILWQCFRMFLVNTNKCSLSFLWCCSSWTL